MSWWRWRRGWRGPWPPGPWWAQEPPAPSGSSEPQPQEERGQQYQLPGYPWPYPPAYPPYPWFYYPPPPPPPLSPEEELKMLEEYKRELEEELRGVEERIKELRRMLEKR